ncbi:MAG: polysaccharide biosynthesis/export family protein [bacterium]
MKKLILIVRQVIYFEVAVFFLTACTISPRLLPVAGESNESTYKIRVGDVIELKFENYPDFNQTIIVNTDGTASLKALGAMNFSGLSPKALEELLYEKYSYMLVEPKIEVKVHETKNFAIYIGGEVKQPGVMKFKGNITLVQGILLAGGLKDKTMEYEVLIFRNKGIDGVKMYKINIKKNITGRGSNRNFKLNPYDVVYVMKASNINLKKGQLI